ncbi:AraC family transcriptional regulator [Paenibacillus gorillae]|uniref:AraC family transcriptional regulator n=1 Tax=Paenibacillus gorillae TaxID=1243662 RepID=UPI0004BA65D9|nr:AraC family transcriptional regulator [Paenibacillus gorillae]
MNSNAISDLQHYAAGQVCYKLLSVEQVKSVLGGGSDRNFIQSRSHVLLLSKTSHGRLVINGKYYPLRQGGVYVCPPGHLIEAETGGSGTEPGLMLLHFEGFFMPVEEPDLGGEAVWRFPFAGEAVIHPASSVIHIFDLLHAGWSEGKQSSRLRCEAGLLELLGLVLGYQEQQMELALETAKMELERNYKEDITIDQLAGVAGLSRFHFMRLFKERYGRGIMEYRTELRLMEAKRMMTSPSAPSLAVIAEAIGYKNETYFRNLFKKQTGIPPAAYQKNQKYKIAAYSWMNIGMLLPLQMIPFAAPVDHYWTDYYRNRYSFEIKLLLSHHYEFNREILRKAEPDFIIGIDHFIPAEEQEKLKSIAPTLLLPWKGNWREHLSLTAAFIGREEEAGRWLERYEQKSAVLRKQLGAMTRRDTVAVFVVSKGQLHVWGRKAGTVLYNDLQLGMPPAVADIDWLEPIELQHLEAYYADRVLVHVEEDPLSQAYWSQLSRHRDWKRLAAACGPKLQVFSGNDLFKAPWNEYSAHYCERFLDEAPELFRIAGAAF